MRYSIIRFPGSNCDYDSYYIAEKRNNTTSFIWHKDTSLQNPDVVILPGGFSYGDYLRCGIIARFSPIIKEVVKFAGNGGFVLGICNGFQILTECGLLPGALMMNRDLKFICQHQYVKVCNNRTAFTSLMEQDSILDLPIAHKEGNYYIDKKGHEQLLDNEQIVFRYSSKERHTDEKANPNGSLDNIAGIINTKGNVLGMMPHPERNAEVLRRKERTDKSSLNPGNRIQDEKADGANLFASIEKYFHSSS